jgi:hypothetical protein
MDYLQWLRSSNSICQISTKFIGPSLIYKPALSDYISTNFLKKKNFHYGVHRDRISLTSPTYFGGHPPLSGSINTNIFKT